jgi:SAM-dependent methyltransferase
METCYKVFRTEILKTIPIRSNGFGIEPEITAKVAKRGLRVYEVPITYQGRTYFEGKKITWRDGVKAFWVLLRECFTDDAYYEVAGHAVLAELSHARRFNHWMAEVIRPHVGHSVLEIGAGIGNLTSLLLPRDRYVATDVDEAYLRVLGSWADRGNRFEVGAVNVCNPVDFKPYQNSFDTVVCLNVLEHVLDPDQALANIRSALRSGGRAIVLVPQGPWLYSKLDSEIGHVKRYTRDQLTEELKRAGFVIDGFFDFNRSSVPGWFVNCRLLGRTRLPEVQLRLYNLLVPIMRRVDPWLPWHGLSLIAVARSAGES